MTIDEAIAHAREVAKEKYAEGMLCHANPNDEMLDECIKCAEEHEHLAEWLEDYKRLLEFEKSVLANEDGYLATMCERKGYNKAIDDFYKKLCSELIFIGLDFEVEIKKTFYKIAKQLKAGGADETVSV